MLCQQCADLIRCFFVKWIRCCFCCVLVRCDCIHLSLHAYMCIYIYTIYIYTRMCSCCCCCCCCWPYFCCDCGCCCHTWQYVLRVIWIDGWTCIWENLPNTQKTGCAYSEKSKMDIQKIEMRIYRKRAHIQRIDKQTFRKQNMYIQQTGCA